MRAIQFPSNFRWGTATSSYQVEGHLTNNDWWEAARTGGYIYENQDAGNACDWWHRAEEDFDRMVALNQNAHRLSIEWSRIEPREGVWDEDALDRYYEMIVGLRLRGIEPMVTLHHFTNPLWLSEQGGWENSIVIERFERFTRKVVSALSDHVDMWCTINEPAVMIAQAYGLGRWAPGKKDLNAALHVALNTVRGHAAAYHAIHEIQPGAQVGLAKHMIDWRPWRPWFPNDQIAANIVEHMFNHLPLMMVTQGIMRVPGKRSVLLPEAANTLDWLGVNYYQRYRIQLSLLLRQHGLLRHRYKKGAQKGPGDWGEIDPSGMFKTLRKLWRRYRLPMYITENGIPDAEDAVRPAFIVQHLEQVRRAIGAAIPVAGYYFWSLVDNFEWTEGYDPRFSFGLIDVDFETQERVIRPSGYLYGAISKANAITEEIVSQYTPSLAPALFTP